MDRKNAVIILLSSVIFALSALLLVQHFTGSEEQQDTGVTGASYRDLANKTIYAERENIITRTVNEVNPAVVGINVTEIRQFRDPLLSPFYDDPFFRHYFGDRTYSQEVQGLGSGFIISDDGYVLTNDHVAGNASEIVITMTNGKHYPAEIVGTDPYSDICLLKIDGEDLPYLKFGNSDDILIGEWAIALGNPFGLFDVNDKPTVTVGVISALNMHLNQVGERFYLDMIQTDAAINGGNSGGPLVNSLGEVIGMNTLIFTAGARGNIGLGFAIPINKVKRIIKELKEEGKIDREFITGLAVQNIDDEVARYFELESKNGVIVTKVVRNSPAAKAGLKPMDIITYVDDFKINSESNLLGVLYEYRTGDTVTLTVIRDGKKIELNMDLERVR